MPKDTRDTAIQMEEKMCLLQRSEVKVQTLRKGPADERQQTGIGDKLV